MTLFCSTLSPEGRVVVPASLRSALALFPGDTVTFRLEGDHSVISSRSAALSRLQALFAETDVSTGHPLLSNELIAERRAEAARESSDG